MGFDFITIAPLLQSHSGFFFVFGCRVSFGVGSSGVFVLFCFFVLGGFLAMVVHQLVVILVLF